VKVFEVLPNSPKSRYHGRVSPFFYHPRMLSYDFGPRHPLKPERLRRAVELLKAYGVQPTDPGPGTSQDALRVHDPEYVEVVRRLSDREPLDTPVMREHGFGSVDNPVFSGMYEASLAYTSGSARAAEAVRDGEPLAFGLAGGLHHAHRDRASGFCIFNDAAVAIDILKERFRRVAYVDIDVHHGDGVQWLFYDDPDVLTCSIHESPRSLFPGTGDVHETGAALSALNVPLEAGTTGDTWLWAFKEAVIPTMESFRPEAVVLQMGTDPHYLDPLAHLRVAAQEWLEAVKLVKDLGLPMVAVGGGGYEITCVPRMWCAAVLGLMGIPFEDRVASTHAEEWRMPTFFDHQLPQPRGLGRDEAEQVVSIVRSRLKAVA